MDKYNIELIKWADSYGVSASWEEINPVDEIPHVHCFSIGYIVAEDEEHIVVVPHMHPENDVIGATESGCGDMTIPKCSIVEREILKARKDDVK